MHRRVNIIWLSQHDTNAIKSVYNDLQLCSCIYCKQPLETIPITSCDLASSGRYRVQGVKKVLYRSEPTEVCRRFSEMKHCIRKWVDAVILHNCSNNFWTCWPGFSPAWQRLETIKIRQVLWKMMRKEIFLIIHPSKTRGQKSHKEYSSKREVFLSGVKALSKVQVFLKADKCFDKNLWKAKGYFLFCCFVLVLVFRVFESSYLHTRNCSLVLRQVPNFTQSAGISMVKNNLI